MAFSENSWRVLTDYWSNLCGCSRSFDSFGQNILSIIVTLPNTIVLSETILIEYYNYYNYYNYSKWNTYIVRYNAHNIENLISQVTTDRMPTTTLVRGPHCPSLLQPEKNISNKCLQLEQNGPQSLSQSVRSRLVVSQTSQRTAWGLVCVTVKRKKIYEVHS